MKFSVWIKKAVIQVFSVHGKKYFIITVFMTAKPSLFDKKDILVTTLCFI